VELLVLPRVTEVRDNERDFSPLAGIHEEEKLDQGVCIWCTAHDDHLRVHHLQPEVMFTIREPGEADRADGASKGSRDTSCQYL